MNFSILLKIQGMSFLIQARFKLMSFVVQQDLEWTSSPFGRLS